MSHKTKSSHFYLLSLLSIAILIFSLPLIGQAKPSPLSLTNILVGLRSKKVTLVERNKLLTDAVIERGITFSLTLEIQKELKTTGANNKLIEAIKQKSVIVRSTDTANLKTKAKLPKYKNNLAKNLSAKKSDTPQKKTKNYQEKVESKDEATQDSLQLPENAEIAKPILENKETTNPIEENTAQPILSEPFTRNRVVLLPIQLGQLNNFAVDLVKPSYPLIAKKTGIKGKVTVQITIDENGKVLSAQAIEGPSVLREASEKAAQKSIFKSALDNQNQAVKATGYLIYNFQSN